MSAETLPINESLRCKQCGKLCASKNGLGMHILRAHNGGNWGYNGKASKPVSSTKPMTTPPLTDPEPKKRPRKPSRSRRKMKVEATLPSSPIPRSEGKVVVEVEPRFPKRPLNYCPCCGTDLSIIIRAMQIAEGVRNG